MLRTKRFQRFTAMLLIASLFIMTASSCDKDTGESESSSSDTTVVIEATSSETSEEETRETAARRVVVEIEAYDAVMSATGRGIIRGEASLQSQSVGVFQEGDEFHVIGIAGDFYVVEMPDGTSGFIVMGKVSEVTEPSETEETEASEESAPSDTSDPSEGSSETTAPSEGAPAVTTTAGSTAAPSAAPSTPDTTAAPAETAAPETAPAAPAGPDLNVTYNGNAIGAYEVEGVGTVYGYFVDTSYFNSLINNHRSELGLTPWNYTYSDATRLRAIECSVSFSHTRPNGQSCLSLFGGSGGEIIYSATDNEAAYNAFLGSDGHRGIIEDSQYYFPNACSAAFVRVEWNGSSWQYAGASLVNNCW